MRACQVRVPASSANIGSGVDCLGLALNLYLTVTFSPADTQRVIFSDGFGYEIPDDKNLVLAGAKLVFARAGRPFPPLRIEMRTEIPASRGLGSSASAIVAGVWGANALLGQPFSPAELLDLATGLEGHPDNVVPCAVGGFTAAMLCGDTVAYHRIVPDARLRYIAAVPDYELSTRLARSVVPQSFALPDVIAQVQHACFLVSGLATGDLRALDQATGDLIFTPARRPLLPGYDEATAAARAQGALCAMISGAGPTIIAFATENAKAVAQAMRQGFERAGISAVSHLLRADLDGAVVRAL